MTNPAASPTGRWHGFLHHEGDAYRIVLTLEHAGDGWLTAKLDSPDQGDLNMAVEHLIWQKGQLAGDVPAWPASLALTLQPNGALSGVVRGDWVWGSLTLRCEDTTFDRYEIPRLANDSQPAPLGGLSTPETMDDGWAVAPLAEAELHPEPLARLIQAILDEELPQAHSVLVARHGRLVVEEYFYGHHRLAKHCLQSATKSITSVLVGIALDQRLIAGLDTPVWTLFPERTTSRWVKHRYPITLWHVLTMQAGLAWNEELPYTDPRNDNTAMNLSGDWIGYVLDRELVGLPGQRYQYVSGLSLLLGAIIRNVSGLPVDGFARDWLFRPLGIEAFTWTRAPDGMHHTGGGLFLRPRDALKIGQIMMDGGMWQGQRVVSESWARDSVRKHTPLGDYDYGYQWHLRTLETPGEPVEAFCAAGYGGQWIFGVPALDMVTVFTAGAYGGDSKPIEKMEKYVLRSAIHDA